MAIVQSMFNIDPMRPEDRRLATLFAGAATFAVVCVGHVGDHRQLLTFPADGKRNT